MKSANVRDERAQRFSRRALLVELGALRILLRPSEPVEGPDAWQEARDLGRGLGKGQGDDLGTTCADLRAFEWVVVEKHEGCRRRR